VGTILVLNSTTGYGGRLQVTSGDQPIQLVIGAKEIPISGSITNYGWVGNLVREGSSQGRSLQGLLKSAKVNGNDVYWLEGKDTTNQKVIYALTQPRRRNAADPVQPFNGTPLEATNRARELIARGFATQLHPIVQDSVPAARRPGVIASLAPSQFLYLNPGLNSPTRAGHFDTLSGQAGSVVRVSNRSGSAGEYAITPERRALLNTIRMLRAPGKKARTSVTESCLLVD
jgi:hypothetical protein